MIHKNWHELIKPSGLNLVNDEQKPNFATIVVEPLERGFGLTLGNALRRTLLSSLQGASITSVKINSVLHEFSSIPGVREDVTDIVLNLKAIAVGMEVEGPKRLSLKEQGPKAVTAGDIVETNGITILNKDAINIARQRGAKTVDLTSRPSRQSANRLYNRLGFIQRETNIYRFEI